MKSVGIVVEYNPLHNGHLYHMHQSRELSKADVVIGVMSPNFVQRGEPAIVDKKRRVQAALEAGVNLLVELPTLYAVESADIFAKYALQILNTLCVNSICFGSETGDREQFLKKYSKSSLLTPHLDFLVSDLMKEGYAYPKAMAMALEKIDEFKLETPNDILGLAYYNEIKKNNYPIEIYTIKRENNYNSIEMNEKSISSRAIRNALHLKQNVKPYTPMYKELQKDLFFLEEYFQLLKYKIFTMSSKEMSEIHMMEEGIENLFKKKIYGANNMEEFISRCVSKRYTISRIKRTIIHLLLNTRKEFAQEYLGKDIGYIRVLGFDALGSKYLKEKRKEFVIPILSKYRGQSFNLLQFEKQATAMYGYAKDNNISSKLYDEEHHVFPIRYN